MSLSKVFRFANEAVGTAAFINRIHALLAVVFVVAIGSMVLLVPQPVMAAVMASWFLLVGLAIWSSVSWARGHLDPESLTRVQAI